MVLGGSITWDMLLSPESVEEMRIQLFEEYRKAYDDGRQQSIISIKWQS
jgi:hypothetical protein